MILVHHVLDEALLEDALLLEDAVAPLGQVGTADRSFRNRRWSIRSHFASRDGRGKCRRCGRLFRGSKLWSSRAGRGRCDRGSGRRRRRRSGRRSSGLSACGQRPGDHAEESQLVLPLLLGPALLALLPPLLGLQLALQPRLLQGEQALLGRPLPGQEAGQRLVQGALAAPAPAAALLP